MKAKANKTKTLSPLSEALLETAADMHKSGMFSDAEFEKITIRHLGKERGGKLKPVSADEVRTLRERAHMSQAVFAHLLNVTTGYVSKLERGAKRPTGPALVLLNVIRRKGMEAIL
jgi:putative transcriptional regulator